MLRSVDLKDYMLEKPITIAPDASLHEAVDLITSNKVSGLCVTREDGTLLGILSELDCLRGILAATYSQGTVGLVSEHMITENINSARISDDIINVANDMLAKGQRRRPVVSDNNLLVGQITCRQILAGIRHLGATP
ncbi:CBS domain-containing protein [Pseudohongiella sp.]|uniref:CBS domain-containing protein n=1 Tax=marine sediment metagenome TaxID=412755 RepID=A0A0F9VZ46_9ZZZZ|nr:CBS domain-containing protein [Pseudohongiella sp.]HDZ10491.1 CBS domain-containing protein [Pseudohongiella sp.]HEA63874.1 CBS domain-containing protein [Pseudohongiella sp.]